MNPDPAGSPTIQVVPDVLMDPVVRNQTGRIILHLDMDCFYASVEVQRRPHLAGKPVVVGADPGGGSGRGVVSTCSYEARAYGIRSAMPISQAYALCPHAAYLRPDLPAYAQASLSVMELLRSYGLPMEQVSIDEAFLDISSLKEYSSAQSFGMELMSRIKKDLGLSCSVGISPSRSVAKIASDFHKPGGLTIIPPDAVQEFLAPLPVRKILGVGKKAECALFEMGIRTIGDLAHRDVQCLIGRFGRSAVPLHQLARGIDGSGIVEQQDVKSISRETTFAADTDDMDAIGVTLDVLIRHISRNLAREHLRFRTLTLKIRYSGFVTQSRSRSLLHGSADPVVIRTLVRSLFRELYDGRKIRLIGIRLSGFEKPDPGQAALRV
jgi:DNA polymerase IV (DinB-like DNA polymerase)